MHWNLGRARAGVSQSAGCVGSAAMATPKKGEFCLVSDYRAVNRQIETIPGVMPNQGAEMADLRGATCFGKLYMLQRYRQISLAAEIRKVFTTPEGLLSPTRMLQGVLNATAYFQDVTTECSTA